MPGRARRCRLPPPRTAMPGCGRSPPPHGASATTAAGPKSNGCSRPAARRGKRRRAAGESLRKPDGGRLRNAPDVLKRRSRRRPGSPKRRSGSRTSSASAPRPSSKGPPRRMPAPERPRLGAVARGGWPSSLVCLRWLPSVRLPLRSGLRSRPKATRNSPREARSWRSLSAPKRRTSVRRQSASGIRPTAANRCSVPSRPGGCSVTVAPSRHAAGALGPARRSGRA
jgi:hypothetical protein